MKKFNFSTEQLNYFQAKAKFETIAEQREIEIEKSGADDLIPQGRRTPANRELSHKRLEIISAIENKLGYWDARMELLDAEEKMIEWSHEQVKLNKRYESQKETMEYLFSNYKKYTKIKDQIVEAACKLIPNSVKA